MSWSFLAQVLEMSGFMSSCRRWFLWCVMRSYHGLLVMSSSSDVRGSRMMHWFFCNYFLHGSGSVMYRSGMINWCCLVNRGSLVNWGGRVNWCGLVNRRSHMNRGSMMNWCCLVNRWSLMNWGSNVSGLVVHWSSLMGSRSFVMDRSGNVRSIMMHRSWLFRSFLFK